jgi:hypothetical protein
LGRKKQLEDHSQSGCPEAKDFGNLRQGMNDHACFPLSTRLKWPSGDVWELNPVRRGLGCFSVTDEEAKAPAK